MKSYNFIGGAGMSDEQAAIFGPLIVSIAQENEGMVTPEKLLSAASESKDARLRSYFDWDDRSAAKSWRLEQARYILRKIRIEVTIKKGAPVIPVRAFVSIRQKEEKPAYVGLSDALENPEWRKQLLNQALIDLRAFQAKYSKLKELSELMDEISIVLSSHGQSTV